MALGHSQASSLEFPDMYGAEAATLNLELGV